MELKLLSLGKKCVTLCGGWSFVCELAVSDDELVITVPAWNMKQVGAFINDMKNYFVVADRAVEGNFRFTLLPDALARVRNCPDE
jgi:hypothetical protein